MRVHEFDAWRRQFTYVREKRWLRVACAHVTPTPPDEPF